MEAVTIIDVLRRADINVVTAGLDDEPIRGSRGVTLIADTNINKIVDDVFDMVVLPGGLPGSTHLGQDSRIISLLKKAEKEGRFIAAICAAPKILANLGLLNNKQATAYPGVLEKSAFSEVQITNQAVVWDGQMITSRGPGTALDFALTLVESLVGKTIRNNVEQGLARTG